MAGLILIMLSVPASAKCTAGPSAVTGERCGAPAVAGFVSSDGRAHCYECAAHAPASSRDLEREVRLDEERIAAEMEWESVRGISAPDY